jgi:hypothetical protein
MKNRIKIYQIIVSVFVLVAFHNATQAQISGYQGKRFSIGYGGNIGYAMFSRNSSGSSLFATSDMDFPEKLFSFNYKHQAQMELVLSNKHVLGVQSSYGKTQFKAFHSGDSYSSTTGYDNHFYSSNLDEDIYANMKFLTFGLYLKSFTSNTAPIGKYWGYKLAVLRYSTDITGIKMPSDYPIITIPVDEYHTSAVFSITKGTSRVYFNRMLVDTGFEFGLPFVFPGYGNLGSNNLDGKITKRMNSRLWGNFLINVNVNVSLLAF